MRFINPGNACLAVPAACGDLPGGSLPPETGTVVYRPPLIQRENAPIVATEATIVIADIRGFTALMESLPAERMVRVLNRFFALMTEVIERHGGMVDKFMGDSVMALFATHANHSGLLPALACAVDMQRAMVSLNRLNESQGDPALFVGIAVSTGQVMAGSFGSQRHREYTVIGDPVNMAARIEAYSLRGQILVGESTYNAARDYIDIGGVNAVLIKGKRKPVNLYELKAVTQPRRLIVPEVEIRRSPRVKVEIPMQFRRVEHKRIMGEYYPGTINNLGYFGMSADLATGLPAYAEILTSLGPQSGLDSTVEIYARVLRTNRQDGGFRVHLQFTTIDTPEHLRVKRLVDNMLWRA